VRLAAAAKKNCFLKDKFWRITSKSGVNKSPAVVAIGYTLLALIYPVLLTGKPYQDKRLPVLDQPKKQRMLRHHICRLGRLVLPSIPRDPPIERLCHPSTKGIFGRRLTSAGLDRGVQDYFPGRDISGPCSARHESPASTSSLAIRSSSPGNVFCCHSTDQLSEFCWNRRLSYRLGFRVPEKTETFPVPTDKGVGVHEHQSAPPVQRGRP
jgi:hypothetical protein